MRPGPPGSNLRAVILGWAMATAPFLASAAGQDTAALKWIQDPSSAAGWRVELSGLDPRALGFSLARGTTRSTEDWQRLLSVHSGEGILDPTLPAMAGVYEARSNVVMFIPAFPLQPGISYRASYRPWGLPGSGPGGTPISALHRMPAVAQEPVTVVSAVYPTASELPANLLKFYLQFSGSMSRGQVYDHVRLLDEKGVPVELPFLEIDEELWDPDMTRLTLLFDPGRIKRGVKPLEDVGGALFPGQSYSLVVDRGWLDAAGRPMKLDYRKTFKVGISDREPIHPENWKLEPVRAGTRHPFKVDFGEPLEHALARRLIRVVDPAGNGIAGQWTLGFEERSATFVPDSGWQTAGWKLRVSHVLEDLAGNNPGKAFDVDLFERVERHLTETYTDLPVPVTPAERSSSPSTSRRRRR